MTKRELKIYREAVLKSYIIEGVPYDRIKEMCRIMKIRYSDLKEFLAGQTMGLVGDTPIVYPCDIEKFIHGLPNTD